MFHTVSQLSKLYKVDPRVIRKMGRSGKWGAKVRNADSTRCDYVFECPPTVEPAMVPSDLARLMAVSRQLVNTWCKTGRVNAFRVQKLWRIEYRDGVRLLERRM